MTRVWFALGYALDVLVVATFAWAGVVTASALAVYAGVFGATYAFFLWWSFLPTLTPRANSLLDGATRLVTLGLLLSYPWWYPATAFYFIGLAIMLLCVTHLRTDRMPWLRPAIEWAIAAAACAALVGQLGDRLAPPFGTEGERVAVAVALALLLARAAVLGYWQNERRRSLAHFKARWRELSASLEDQVAQRTRELEARNAELAEVNRQLRGIARAVAHDFRQPVITVAGHAGALRHELQSLDPRHGAQLDRIRAAARHMELICDGMQRLMQIEQAQLSVQEVDVSALALRIARALVQDDGFTIAVADGLRVQADPRLLGTALEVLLANARTACSGRSDGRVDVYACELESGLGICVEDNGAGIAPDRLPDLFTPFTRLHSDRDYRGTGVGLAVAERIARRHGGSLTVRSQPGAGACFSFNLPARSAAASRCP